MRHPAITVVNVFPLRTESTSWARTSPCWTKFAFCAAPIFSPLTTAAGGRGIGRSSVQITPESGRKKNSASRWTVSFIVARSTVAGPPVVSPPCESIGLNSFPVPVSRPPATARKCHRNDGPYGSSFFSSRIFFAPSWKDLNDACRTVADTRGRSSLTLFCACSSDRSHIETAKFSGCHPPTTEGSARRSSQAPRPG